MNATSLHRKFFLARSPESSLVASKSVNPGDAPGNRQVRLLSWNMEIVGKFALFLSMPRYCSRCFGFDLPDRITR